MMKWHEFSWSKALLELTLGVVIAALLYLVLMNIVVGKAILFSLDTRRIVEVYKFCTSLQPTPHQGINFIVGSSVAVDGVDASLLDQTLNNGTNTYNLGVVGLSPVEALILSPALKAGKPQFVVVGIDVMGMGVNQAGPHEPEGIDFEKLQAYRAINSIAQMNASVKTELFDQILLPKEKAMLGADYLSYLLDCRSLPVFFTESKFREWTRKGLRTEGIVSNFKSPWMLQDNVTDEAKERIINSAITVAGGLSFTENNRNIKALRTLTRMLRAEQIDFMLVLWPLHPRLLSNLQSDVKEKAEITLQTLAQETGSHYLNYSNLLAETDFVDALHPNGEGRNKLSAALAKDMKVIAEHLPTP